MCAGLRSGYRLHGHVATRPCGLMLYSGRGRTRNGLPTKASAESNRVLAPASRPSAPALL